MFLVRTVAVACAMGIAAAACASAQAKPRVRTLTVVAQLSQTERGFNDVAPSGRSMGDVYVSSAPISNKAGKVVGTYDLSCTITDEDQGGGLARTMCTSSTTINGRGEIVAAGISVLRPSSGTPGPLGLLAREAEFAVIGGTGDFVGARGSVVSKRSETRRTLRYRYRL
jgi:hypothetical protein